MQADALAHIQRMGNYGLDKLFGAYVHVVDGNGRLFEAYGARDDGYVLLRHLDRSLAAPVHADHLVARDYA